MKIGIDARPLTVDKFTGIPNYVYQICKEWMEKHPEHEYYLMARLPICFKQEELPANWHIISEPWIVDNTKLWFLFQLPKQIKELGLDAYWGPNYSLPRKVRGTRYFLSIMDMAIFKLKHVGQWRNSLQIKLFLKKNVKKSEHIIVISESTKKDVVDILNVPAKKVDVTYIAGDTENNSNKKNIKDDANQNDIRQEFQDLEDYFLFVGTIEPRKNIATIVKGFYRFCDNNPEGNVKLVLAGGKGWNCNDIYFQVENSRYSEKILMPGFVSDSEKEFLYKHAVAFVYPSLYEGFGMPILEAFKYGTPVITANNSSLPEVGGNAAFYIETYDVEGLSDMMKHVNVLDEEERGWIREESTKQLKKFSWEKCAEKTLHIITSQ